MAFVYGDRVHEVGTRPENRTVFRLLSIPAAFGALFLSGFQRHYQIHRVFMILSYTVCPALRFE
jgi:hypothetical protein